jgi:mannose-6-phosphate isomerase-like protein (cupin superfamily)
VKKIIVADVHTVIPSNLDLAGVAVKNLIDRSSASGGYHKLHRHQASAQISYLISGEGEHLTENGAGAINAGDATYVPFNSWHEFRNSGRENALLLSAYNPAADLAAAGYESHCGESILDELGRADVLVNNALVSFSSPPDKLSITCDRALNASSFVAMWWEADDPASSLAITD